MKLRLVPRRRLTALLVLVIFVKSLVPPGFMPASLTDGEGFVTICPGQQPVLFEHLLSSKADDLSRTGLDHHHTSHHPPSSQDILQHNLHHNGGQDLLHHTSHHDLHHGHDKASAQHFVDAQTLCPWAMGLVCENIALTSLRFDLNFQLALVFEFSRRSEVILPALGVPAIRAPPRFA